MIKRNIYRDITTRINLVLIVKKYVNLRRIGQYHSGLCPFHKENIPSFFVTSKYYRCYGCGSHGDVIAFLSYITNKSYHSTVKYILKKFDIVANYIGITFQSKRHARYKFVLGNLYQYFQNTLLKNKNICIEYLIKFRNISLYTIKKYGIGYGGLTKYDFFLFLKKNHILLKEICKLGIIKYREIWIFLFDNRIIFPIKNIKGEIVSFIGRTILVGKHEQKYLNCLNTLLYNKNKSFFGYFEASNRIIKQNIIIVEGPLDVLSFYEMGYLAISLGGHFINFSQIQIIKQTFSSVIMCLDNDVEGLKGTLLLLKFFLQYKIYPYLFYILTKDVNDIFQFKPIKLMPSYLWISIDFLENIIYRIYFHTYSNKIYQIQYTNSILKIINAIQNRKNREGYIKKLIITSNNILYNKKSSYSINNTLKNIYIDFYLTFYVNYVDKMIIIIFLNNIRLLAKEKFIKKIIKTCRSLTKIFFLKYIRLTIENTKKIINLKNYILNIRKYNISIFYYLKYLGNSQ